MNQHNSITAAEVIARLRRDPAVTEKESTIAHIVSKNVLRLRVDRGWTQRELAQRAGMRQPRIAELESGDGNPGLKTIDRVATALGVPARSLFDALGPIGEPALWAGSHSVAHILVALATRVDAPAFTTAAQNVAQMPSAWKDLDEERFHVEPFEFEKV